MWKKHLKCRACDNPNLIDVFNLGVVPLANSFKAEGEDQGGFVPLTVAFCERCTLAQLRQTVSPQILYAKNYLYETSKSETMRLHFRSLWDAIKEQSKAESVLEIGSNDGDFLSFARDNGAEAVAGIDPAENLAAKANSRGIQTIMGILDDYTAECASRVIPKADVIVARHVFAHVDDWHKFMRNLDTLANVDTLIAIEVPYVVDTLARVELDQIYHEHLSYVSLKAMEALLDGTPFRMQKVMRFTIHGGSIVIFLRRRDHPSEPDVSVQEFLASENITEQTWDTFRSHANSAINFLKFKMDDLLGLRGITRTNVMVCGYGASAKSTVWISACGFTKREISFICDCTPGKQGKFSPGTDIPIVPESTLMELRPDYCIIFAWNFVDEIIAKNRDYHDAGGRFIIPGVRIKII